MHIKLIQANIALFKGERGETQRLLAEYLAEQNGSDPARAMVLWLDAQSQLDRAERLRRLGVLIGSVPPEDYYAQLARGILQEEEYFQVKWEGRGLLSSTRSRLIAAGLLIGLFGLLALAMIARPPAPIQTSLLDNPTLPPPTLINLPDQSQALVPETYTARYPGGILQIAAYEEDSARVINDGALVLPVPGARFFALKLIFECRTGICNEPPQARLSLALGDGTFIEPRDDVNIINENPLQPIALGRTSAGWVVFEVPLVSSISALVVSPVEETDSPAFQPISIPLPAP